MASIITNIIGYLAAIVGTSIMFPQVIKSLKTKKVEDISFLMIILFLVNCFLWTIYGFLMSAFPVIICNVLAFIILLFQLFLKIKYSPKREITDF